VISGAGERLVIDASVAVKWVVPENDSDKAEFLLDQALVAPDLLFAECANILWKKVRRGEVTKEEAEIAAQTLEQADLTVVSARAYTARAAALAIELDHPAYDGMYLAVAEALGLRLVTADDRLVRKARQAGSRFQPLVLLLSEIKPG
jgi:predicted nucleic acid-binding protein